MRKEIHGFNTAKITDDALQRLDPIEEAVPRVGHNINIEKCKASLPGSAAEFMEIRAQALRKLPRILHNIKK